MVRLRISGWSRQRGQFAHRRARRIQRPALHTRRRPSEVPPADYELPPRRDRAPDEVAAPNRARRGEILGPGRPLRARWWHGCHPNQFQWPVLSYRGLIFKRITSSGLATAILFALWG